MQSNGNYKKYEKPKRCPVCNGPVMSEHWVEWKSKVGETHGWIVCSNNCITKTLEKHEPSRVTYV